MRFFALAVLVPLAAFASAGDQGLHALVQGNYPLAERELRAAAAEHPRDGRMHFNLASTLREEGRGNEALAEYRLAYDNAPDRKTQADALYGIALTRDGQGDPILASQAWQQYIAFAQPYRNEQYALPIARAHLAQADQLAGLPGRVPGTQKAAR